MQITTVTNLATQALGYQVVKIDGPVENMLLDVPAFAAAHGLRCIGVNLLVDLQGMFGANGMADYIHLETMDSINDLSTLKPDLVLIAPSALLGDAIDAVVNRILKTVPGTRIICATGILNLQTTETQS